MSTKLSAHFGTISGFEYLFCVHGQFLGQKNRYTYLKPYIFLFKFIFLQEIKKGGTLGFFYCPFCPLKPDSVITNLINKRDRRPLLYIYIYKII